MGVTLPEAEYDLLRTMSGRLTSTEYAKASATKQREDEGQGDCAIESDDVEKLDEELWYQLSEK